MLLLIPRPSLSNPPLALHSFFLHLLPLPFLFLSFTTFLSLASPTTDMHAGRDSSDPDADNAYFGGAPNLASGLGHGVLREFLADDMLGTLVEKLRSLVHGLRPGDGSLAREALQSMALVDTMCRVVRTGHGLRFFRPSKSSPLLLL